MCLFVGASARRNYKNPSKYYEGEPQPRWRYSLGSHPHYVMVTSTSTSTFSTPPLPPSQMRKLCRWLPQVACVFGIVLAVVAHQLAAPGVSPVTLLAAMALGVAWVRAYSLTTRKCDTSSIGLVASITGPAIGVLAHEPLAAIGLAAVLSVRTTPLTRWSRIIAYTLGALCALAPIRPYATQLAASGDNIVLADDYLVSLVISQTEAILVWRWPFYLWGLAAGLLLATAVILGARRVAAVPAAAFLTVTATVFLAPQGALHAPHEFAVIYTLCLAVPLGLQSTNRLCGITGVATGLALLTFTASQLQYFWYDALHVRVLSSTGSLSFAVGTLLLFARAENCHVNT